MDEDRISSIAKEYFPRPTTFAQASFISSLRVLADALEAFPDVKAVAVDTNEECETTSQAHTEGDKCVDDD